MMKKLVTWGVLSFVFLLPWQARYIFNLTPGTELLFNFYALYALDILFFLLAAIWGVCLIKSRKDLLPKLSKFERVSLLISAAFLALAYAQIQFAPYAEITSYKWDRLLQAWLLFMMAVTLKIPVKKILLSLVAAGLLQSCLATAQFFIQAIPPNTYLGIAQQLPETPGSSVIDYAGGRWLRGYGSLPHPNILGGFLVICVLIVSHWYLQAYRKLASFHGKFKELASAEKRAFAQEILLSFSAFLVLFLGLLMTFSRAAWLGFAFGWLVLVVSHLIMMWGCGNEALPRSYLFQAAFKQILVGGLLVVMLSFSFAPFWTSRLFGGSDFTQTSASQREVYLEQARELIAQKPFFGHGMGQYLFVAEAQFPYKTLYDVQPVHNTWLYLWAELGVVGIGVFVLWLYLLFYCLKKKQPLLLSLFSAIGLLYYFDHFWWSTYFGLMIIAILEIIALVTIATKKTQVK